MIIKECIVIEEEVKKMQSQTWINEGIFTMQNNANIVLQGLKFIQSKFMTAVLVSQGYCDKVLQTWGLKTTETYSLTVLETRSLKLRCQQGRPLS